MLPVVKDVPAGCKKCGSTEYVVLQTTRQTIGRFVEDGVVYTQKTWRRVKCKGCLQNYFRNQYRK